MARSSAIVRASGSDLERSVDGVNLWTRCPTDRGKARRGVRNVWCSGSRPPPGSSYWPLTNRRCPHRDGPVAPSDPQCGHHVGVQQVHHSCAERAVRPRLEGCGSVSVPSRPPPTSLERYRCHALTWATAAALLSRLSPAAGQFDLTDGQGLVARACTSFVPTSRTMPIAVSAQASSATQNHQLPIASTTGRRSARPR